MGSLSLLEWGLLPEEEREAIEAQIQEKQIIQAHIRSLSLWELIKLKLRR
jgi:hypothetical protein